MNGDPELRFQETLLDWCVHRVSHIKHLLFLPLNHVYFLLFYFIVIEYFWVSVEHYSIIVLFTNV